jgi:uncharacterized membrane protein
VAGTSATVMKDIEERIKEKVQRGEKVSRNVNDIEAEHLTFGQMLADKVAAVAGSWPGIVTLMAAMLAWIVINTYLLVGRAFDPYPYILLNLVLSCLAGLQGPLIMMSQNRQAANDRIRADLDFEVNRKAEMEIAELQTKLDQLRATEWQEMMKMQQQQVTLLGQQVAMLQIIQTKEQGASNG